MKPIIFCNIARMNYYKGIIDGVDEPENGGSYVNKYKNAHEANNFDYFNFPNDNTDYCAGFVMLARTSKEKDTELHIEKINGLELAKNQELVDNVIVVFCAKSNKIDGVRVVGWYKNATVYRYPQEINFESGYIQQFNFIDKKDNCVLLPLGERYLAKWIVPRSGHDGYKFGFGRSNVWYAQDLGEDTGLKAYVEKMSQQIEEYNGENWIDKEVR
ncbi:MAG: hypothetical protein K6F76_03045 [Clostridiales bacterium]|nr:hypothetical protein [Clostridiales bacterium]